ncbi:hypothetical protein [Bacillus changyiensis]|uniref:hypothetical protein n=1 Tax=Bacillus changyiensis TaxID=3004103 RepID=UPI0022E540D3|nr:hypothetical protein [Bacillus changyiensis]MDA1478431.1 hypothetical protein [Bacillus changyiensis]
MKRTWQIVVVLALLISACMNGTSMASAATSKKSSAVGNNVSFDLSQMKFSKDEIERIKETVESDEIQKEAERGLALQPYVDASGTFIKFDHKKALKDGLSPTLVMETKKIYDRANASLAKSQPQFTVSAKCKGSNRYEGNWVSGTLYLNSCTVNKMVTILNGGGGASALIGLIPGGVAAGAISVAVYSLGASILSYNNAEGKGVKIRVLRNPFNGQRYPYWITSQ